MSAPAPDTRASDKYHSHNRACLTAQELIRRECAEGTGELMQKPLGDFFWSLQVSDLDTFQTHASMDFSCVWIGCTQSPQFCAPDLRMAESMARLVQISKSCGMVLDLPV